MREAAPAPGKTNGWATAGWLASIAAAMAVLYVTAFAGWEAIAKFLENGAPAWIQAIGSIAAIVAALAVVQHQHALDLQRREQDELSLQLSRARALRVVFYSAANTCESVTQAIGSPHQVWPLWVARLQAARERLLSIDPMLVPDPGLLLLIEQCAFQLNSCAVIVEQLETPRKEATEKAIRGVAKATAQECWLGFHEATSFEAKLLAAHPGSEALYRVNDFAEARRKLEGLRERARSELAREFE